MSLTKNLIAAALGGALMLGALALAPLVTSETAHAADAPKPAGPKDGAAIVQHVKSHTTYPTTKKKIVEACNNMADINEHDRKWFQGKLPDGEYRSAQDVLTALGLKE
jgi:hypothetical protein